jgi:hypothetical protein
MSSNSPFRPSDFERCMYCGRFLVDLDDLTDARYVYINDAFAHVACTARDVALGEA